MWFIDEGDVVWCGGVGYLGCCLYVVFGFD